MRKPRNLRDMTITNNYLDNSDPYVSCALKQLPLRVTLDGMFGINDLEYIIDKVKKLGVKNEKNQT